jgi:tRNA threonylcarbamoyladenosine biosynthesis protein TsaB
VAAYDLAVGTPRELSGARAVAPGELAASLSAGDGPWLAVGDGAVRYRAELELELPDVKVPADDSPLHLVHAGQVCALGELAEPAPALEQVTPDYRRRPDAEIALKPAAGGAGRQA